jgi:hypothetical protein
MPLVFVVFAIINLAIGFALAVYLGAAPRYANSNLPFLRSGQREPSGFVGKLTRLLPKRKAGS